VAERIILLNGTSSAGKTTIARALQHALEPRWLFLGFDEFVGMLTDSAPDPTDGPRDEDLGHWLAEAWYRAVGGLAAAGFDLIVEDIILEPVPARNGRPSSRAARCHVRGRALPARCCGATREGSWRSRRGPRFAPVRSRSRRSHIRLRDRHPRPSLRKHAPPLSKRLSKMAEFVPLTLWGISEAPNASDGCVERGTLE
jgi:hypothetical protein